MKLVITGALGHIGSRLLRDLVVNGSAREVVLVDNLATQRYCSLFNLPEKGKYRFVEADVLDADMKEIIRGSDAVVHLAAITDAANSFQNKDQVERVNYNATVKVAEACRDAECPMIHLSSTSVYGTQKEVVDEDCSADQLKPQSPYAETKLKEERFLQSLARSGNLRFITCRFGTICGVAPGMRFHTAVNKFCWQAVAGTPLTVWRTALQQKRPYLSLDDAVKAVDFIIKKDIFDGKTYNVLTANLTVQNIVHFIERHVPDTEIKYVDTEIMNQLSYEVLTDRFQALGFRYEGSVENDIAETIQLLRNMNSDSVDKIAGTEG